MVVEKKANEEDNGDRSRKRISKLTLGFKTSLVLISCHTIDFL